MSTLWSGPDEPAETSQERRSPNDLRSLPTVFLMIRKPTCPKVLVAPAARPRRQYSTSRRTPGK